VLNGVACCWQHAKREFEVCFSYAKTWTGHDESSLVNRDRYRSQNCRILWSSFELYRTIHVYCSAGSGEESLCWSLSLFDVHAVLNAATLP
jgi:hypothetical protein